MWIGHEYIRNYGNTELNNEHLKVLAPSVFAEHPYIDRSPRYKFIPTVNIVNALRENNFVPVKAQQSRCRLPDKKEYVKHMIRLRSRDLLSPLLNIQEFPEIVLINSHDGTSSYQLMLGIFKLVCSNGLVVGDTFSKIRTIHMGDKNFQKEIIDASFEVIESAPKILNKIESWKTIELTPEMQIAYAESTKELSPTKLEIQPKRLLQHRRITEAPTKENGTRNLWQTFNIVQENYVKGGLLAKNEKGYRHTRAIKSVTADVKLNKALWTLTEKMEELINNGKLN